MKNIEYYQIQYQNKAASSTDSIAESAVCDSSVTNLYLDELSDKTNYPIDVNNYGTLYGLYHIWKTSKAPYISFSMYQEVFSVPDSELNKFNNSTSNVLLVKPSIYLAPLDENYRTFFYDYDMRTMLTVLAKQEPLYHKFAQQKIVSEILFMRPACIIERNLLQKFCAWLFRILKKCEPELAQKASVFQNRHMEHLGYILFNIYFRYNESKTNVRFWDNHTLNTLPQADITLEEALKALPLREGLQQLIQKGLIEKAAELWNQSDDENKSEFKKIFQKYNRQRRYYKTTILEQSKNLDTLLNLAEPKTPLGPLYKKRKALVFQWKSVNHKESLLAFKKIGFDYEVFECPFDSWLYDDKLLSSFNQLLDRRGYDVVFSINYHPMIAESCYVHDTPYIAWSYDSPTFVGDHRYLGYPTTNMFFFDSNEPEKYIRLGFKNVHYMPLAVNVERFDEIICTPAEKEKYGASISFVGSLYDTKFFSAFNHLSDYRKGFLNGLVDNHFGLYGIDLFADIINEPFMNWISQPDFNQALNAEWDKSDATADTPVAARLHLLLNRLVTHRERLLLLSMMAKHWDVKLYSTSTNEVLDNVIQCGFVEYYQDMPKVFKNSKINLNVTLHHIISGIPLRCLDIMGCHGLLLTNYQSDFEEHFKDGENILMYHSLQEAYDKAHFYLEHETLRQKIEDRGYETVKKHYNYPDVLRKMLSISGLDYLFQ